MAAQILSRPRLSRMIDEFGLYKEESNYLVRDEVIDLMREQIRVEPVIPELEQQQATPRASFEIDQFQIFFRNNDPVVARDVAQELANDFIEEHISTRVQVSQKSVEFIEAELGRLAEAIEKVEATVGEVKAANPGRLPEDMAANQRRLERLTMRAGRRPPRRRDRPQRRGLLPQPERHRARADGRHLGGGEHARAPRPDPGARPLRLQGAWLHGQAPRRDQGAGRAPSARAPSSR